MPNINKVVFGNQTLIDLSTTTLSSASQLENGVTAYARDGSVITGTGSGGVVITDTTDSHGGTIREITAATYSFGTKTITANGTYEAEDDNLDGYSEVTVNVSNSRLPSGYTEIESVQYTGTQYVNTGIEPVQDDVIYVAFKATALSQTGDTIFSAGTGTYQTIVLCYNDNTFAKYFKNGNATNMSPRIAQDKYYELYLRAPTSIFVSEDCVVTSGGTGYVAAIDGTDKKMYLGRRANGNSPFHGHIYSFYISNSGTKKIELVPCVRDSDSKVGFYDLVSDSFFGSNGGDFVAGASLLSNQRALEMLLGE